MIDALSFFPTEVGRRQLDKMLLTFVEQFPGHQRLSRASKRRSRWLAGSTEGTSHRAAALEEMMLLWMANRNVAFRPFDELFEDSAWPRRPPTGGSPSSFPHTLPRVR